MNLLKTKFYPVDLKAHVIHLDPFARERDLARKWSRNGKSCIGLTGAHLMANGCYHAYRRMPTVTQEQLVEDWTKEISNSMYLWESTAITIRDVIRGNTPADALVKLKSYRKMASGMAISASYDRAVREIKELLIQQEQAA